MTLGEVKAMWEAALDVEQECAGSLGIAIRRQGVDLAGFDDAMAAYKQAVSTRRAIQDALEGDFAAFLGDL